MAEMQYDENGIEIPTEVIYDGNYAIIRYPNGHEIKLRGYGSMRDEQLDLDPRIDLTKPIFEQAIKLWKEDAQAALVAADSAAA